METLTIFMHVQNLKSADFRCLTISLKNPTPQVSSEMIDVLQLLSFHTYVFYKAKLHWLDQSIYCYQFQQCADVLIKTTMVSEK